jgi:peptidoglycan hydrolase-like protein with peptidoglycan-binding domain
MPIGASVGIGGQNDGHDVQYVQALLNIRLVDNGEQGLDLDGKVGPLTIGAIQEFQSSQLGFADGSVEPGKTTITALEAQVSGFFPEIKAMTALATVLSFEPAQVEPQPEEEPVMNDAELQTFVQSVSEG